MILKLCPICKHYIGSLKCEAFPRGILKEILDGKVAHDKPIEGDNGIRYEPIKETIKP